MLSVVRIEGKIVLLRSQVVASRADNCREYNASKNESFSYSELMSILEMKLLKLF